MKKVRFDSCEDYDLKFKDSSANLLNDNNQPLTEVNGVQIQAKEIWKKTFVNKFEYECNDLLVAREVSKDLKNRLNNMIKPKYSWTEYIDSQVIRMTSANIEGYLNRIMVIGKLGQANFKFHVDHNAYEGKKEYKNTSQIVVKLL
jgi:hypothetical protein